MPPAIGGARESRVRPAAPLDEAVRRTLDIAVSALFLILAAPLLLLIALLVRLSSPGPALFRQVRVGRNGELFTLFKFRSMRVQEAGPSVTAGGDDRITPVGRFLRNWKLDELPQFLNVLRGEMSLVGPRPEVPRFVELYTPEQRAVLTVKPGVTGVCQLQFRSEEELLKGREDVETFYVEEVMRRKLALDLAYLRDRTVLRDIGILFRTLVALVRR